MKKILLAMLTSLLVSPLAVAIDAAAGFDDPEMQARYERIISEVRCLQCQNESLKDSNAFLAADLRREIRRLLNEGKTDQEVFDFLVQRYGEFALYRPRMKGKTLMLWMAPLFLLGAGALIAVNVVRGRMALPIDDQEGDDGNGQSDSGRNRGATHRS